MIVSELPILRGYFDRNWPLFGQDSTFLPLSVVMMIVGVAVLGDLNKATASDTALGLAFWRIVVSAGILAIIMSVVNVLTVRNVLVVFSPLFLAWWHANRGVLLVIELYLP